MTTILLVLATVLLTGYILFEMFNQTLEVQHIDLEDRRIPASLDGMKILHLSDLHSNVPSSLIHTIKQSKPDLIAASGDWFDGIKDGSAIFTLLDQIPTSTPIVFVPGNHELYRSDWPEIREELIRRKVQVLDPGVMEVLAADGSIVFAGISDPQKPGKQSKEQLLEIMNEQFESLNLKGRKDNTNVSNESSEPYRVLLFHRASFFDELSNWPVDLIVSGHLHGGHWRFFHQGIVAPGNGKRVSFFPKYTSGLYEKNGVLLSVSRGISDNMIIPRLFNRPHVIEIELHAPAALSKQDSGENREDSSADELTAVNHNKKDSE